MKILSLLLGLLFIYVSGSSQDNTNFNLDSIRQQYTLGYNGGNPKLVLEAEQGCRELIPVYKKNKDQKNLAKVFTLLGQILVESGKFQQAKDTLTLALDLSNKEFGSESDETLEAKKYLSWAYGYLGDEDTELKYSVEMLETYKKNRAKYALAIADLYNTISMNYGSRNNRDQERESLDSALKILETYKPKNEEDNTLLQYQLSNVFNSLSQSYISSLDYDNARIYAIKSLQISENSDPNNPERAAPMVALARCLYSLEKKCDSAVYYINNALNLLESNKLKGSTIWLSYRSYKVNILARCGNGDEAKAEAVNTIKTMLAKGDSPEEALSQLLILSQHTNAELTKMENQFREKEAIVFQKQTKERFILFGILCIVLLISGTAFGIYKNRQNKKEIEFQKKELAFQKVENQLQNDLLQQRDEIRKRISKDLHDEIGAGLTHISMICMQGETDLRKQQPIEKPFLDKITSHSIMLSHNLKELIWATKPENDNFLSLCTEIRTYANNFLENSNIILNLKITDDIDSFPTNPETNRNIYLIVKEGLNNIAKYSKATKIDINFSVDTEKNFKLVIADNGKGFDMTVQTKGNGLENMKNRATSIKNGRFELKSEIRKGTTITSTGNLS